MHELVGISRRDGIQRIRRDSRGRHPIFRRGNRSSMLGAFRFGIGFVFGLMVSWATFQGAVTELAVGWILVGT